MTNESAQSQLTGKVLDEQEELTLAEVCQACQVSTEQIIEIVAEGIIDPLGEEPLSWRFKSITIKRIRFVLHVKEDLGVNVAGAALALDLLEELEELRTRLRRFNDKSLSDEH